MHIIVRFQAARLFRFFGNLYTKKLFRHIKPISVTVDVAGIELGTPGQKPIPLVVDYSRTLTTRLAVKLYLYLENFTFSCVSLSHLTIEEQAVTSHLAQG